MYYRIIVKKNGEFLFRTSKLTPVAVVAARELLAAGAFPVPDSLVASTGISLEVLCVTGPAHAHMVTAEEWQEIGDSINTI